LRRHIFQGHRDRDRRIEGQKEGERRSGGVAGALGKVGTRRMRVARGNTHGSEDWLTATDGGISVPRPLISPQMA
jgi:hypothetical protein